ncbi:hypothetical protein AHAS_Ahas16G0296800 [Arachis hypogaea]|uniref:RNase H type-1 domain-containing protein n=1 Tax=Arachis hypogaea TaxID=3818 RepID=A0A444YV30_ARAHY|nr:hypothetical protein Ahy_B06g085601 [Arachis hypogaea]
MAEGVIAVVIQDNSRILLTGESMRIRAHFSLAAEAEAMRRALILATNLNMEQILIESDNLPLVQAVKSKTYIGETNWRKTGDGSPTRIAEQLTREASIQNGCSNRSHSMGRTQNTLQSRIQRQGNLNFGDSMWRRDLMSNSGTLNPFSVVNDADATSLERRNIFVNKANTPGHDNQLGKEKFGASGANY